MSYAEVGRRCQPRELKYVCSTSIPNSADDRTARLSDVRKAPPALDIARTAVYAGEFPRERQLLNRTTQRQSIWTLTRSVPVSALM